MKTLLLFLGAATLVLAFSALAAWMLGRWIANGNGPTDDQDGGAR